MTTYIQNPKPLSSLFMTLAAASQHLAVPGWQSSGTRPSLVPSKSHHSLGQQAACQPRSASNYLRLEGHRILLRADNVKICRN